MTATDELKPCPFCGAKAWLVECPNCGELNIDVNHSPDCWFSTYESEYDVPNDEKESFIGAWNRRADDERA